MPTRLAYVPSRVNGHVVTARERQVQRLLLDGRTPEQIARLGGLSSRRAHEVIASLRRKGLRPAARRQRGSALPAVAANSPARHGLDAVTKGRFGAHLRELRAEHRMTQAELAEGNFTAAFVSMVESGKASPSLKSLILFARRLGVPVRETLPPDL